MSVAVVWFKNDLRADDNAALAAAAAADSMLGVYCLDAAGHADNSRYGPAKLGSHRKAFLRQALADLRDQLAARGGRLLVCAGAPATVLPRLVAAVGADVVHAADEIGPDERDALAAVAAALGQTRLIRHETGGLYRERDLAFRLDDMPRAFTPFRKRLADAGRRCAPIAAPPTLPPPPRAGLAYADDLPGASDWPDTATPFTGGQTAGQARLYDYIWRSQAVTTYKKTRNQLLGFDFSSKLSPWLARGCVSPRRVIAELERFENAVIANESTDWLRFELLWREFFRWTLARHGRRLFRRAGLLGRADRPTARDAATIAAWQRGRTGQAFVDANMVELAQTGYMSNRGRQNAASYFARDLGQDWRLGAAWFEAQLVDYDVASNWGNWANAAGVGTDKRDRGFDVFAQAARYDPDGAFSAYWLARRDDVDRVHHAGDITKDG